MYDPPSEESKFIMELKNKKKEAQKKACRKKDRPFELLELYLSI